MIDVQVVKVSGKSKVSGVAGAIAGFIRSGKEVHVQAVGNDTISRSARAIALATRYLMDDGLPLGTKVEFISIDAADGKKKLEGLRFVLSVL